MIRRRFLQCLAAVVGLGGVFRKRDPAEGMLKGYPLHPPALDPDTGNQEPWKHDILSLRYDVTGLLKWAEDGEGRRWEWKDGMFVQTQGPPGHWAPHRDHQLSHVIEFTVDEVIPA